METRNLTVNLPAELIRQAKIYAAENSTTLNRVVRELLEETVQRRKREKEAVHRLIELAKQGPYSDIDPSSIKRENIYER